MPEKSRDIQGLTPNEITPSGPKGKNYLLAIAIDAYSEEDGISKLSNCVKDAKDLKEVLQQRFGFLEENTITIFDQEATLENINTQLDKLTSRVTPNDKIIVYFSGHGFYKKHLKEGYLIPVDGRKGASWGYLSNANFLTYIRSIDSFHTFLIIDSCFSGSLFATKDIEYAYSDRSNMFPSRWGLTAGQIEKVSDGYHGENSPFANSIITFLKTTDKRKIPVSELIQYVKTTTARNSGQTPMGGAMSNMEDKGGEFVFHLTENGTVPLKEPLGKEIHTGSQMLFQKNQVKDTVPKKPSSFFQKYGKLIFPILLLIPLLVWVLISNSSETPELIEANAIYKYNMNKAKAAFKENPPNYLTAKDYYNSAITAALGFDVDTLAAVAGIKACDQAINNQTDEELNRQELEKEAALQIEFDKLITEGKKYFNNGDYSKALTKYKAAQGKVKADQEAVDGIADSREKIVGQEKKGERIAREKREKEIDHNTWGSAKSKNTVSAYQAYLDGNPNGNYRSQAQIQIDAIHALEKKQRNDPGKSLKQLNVLPVMVSVMGGSFIMGCTSEQGGDCEQNEQPAHEVKIPGFYISKYEITNEEFVSFLNVKGNQTEGGVSWINLEGSYKKVSCGIKKENGKFLSKSGQNKLPVVYVSWYGAQAYGAWLKSKTGKNYRLPSEAEWEFAARGGRSSNGFKYAGSDNLGEVAWSRENANKTTHHVGSVAKGNELGLYDMSGNISEWTADCYNESYEITPKDGSINSSGDCASRVNRGGSWYNSAQFCRVSIRNSNRPNSRDYNLGFRIVYNQ